MRRVEIRWSATREDTALALRAHGATVAEEVLAVTLTETPTLTGTGGAVSTAEEVGLVFTLSRHTPESA